MPPSNPPTYAHVAFLRLPGFAQRSVTEQAAAKEAAEAAVREALADVAAEDRAVLEVDDGLAVVLFGEAERALDVARGLATRAGATPLLVGLNYGPLALTSQGPGARVFGDGIAAAAAAARFTEPGRLLVTEDFATALRATAVERAGELVRAGDFTDTRVRQHTFYAHDAERGAQRRRRLALRTGAIVVAILLAGVVGRDIYQPLKLSRPAVLTFDVKPRGEVFIDGIARAKVPSTAAVEVPPGKRRIVIRSPGAAAFEATYDLRPGEKVTITHTFTPRPVQKPGFLDNLKRRFGS